MTMHDNKGDVTEPCAECAAKDAEIELLKAQNQRMADCIDEDLLERGSLEAQGDD